MEKLDSVEGDDEDFEDDFDEDFDDDFDDGFEDDFNDDFEDDFNDDFGDDSNNDSDDDFDHDLEDDVTDNKAKFIPQAPFANETFLLKVNHSNLKADRPSNSFQSFTEKATDNGSLHPSRNRP